VITVYAGAAFVIIELINNITEPLKLPDWTPTFVIILLAIGFPVVIMFSWIYDFHPEGGMVKTEPADKVKAKEITKSSNSWKIATYVSVVIIIGLIAFNLFGGNRGPKINESLAKSIAVLPFHNLSGEDDQEYMRIGITDEIISHLFRVKSFDEVRSLTSVLKYKDSEENIPEIAEELGVNYILEGSYKRMGDDLKITAQLIETASDNHIWLQDYEIPYRRVMGIPGEIAIQIANHLKTFISDEELERIEKLPTTNIEAYEKYATVRFASILDTDNPLRGPAQFPLDTLLKMIELDPYYADAYAFTAMHFLQRGMYLGTGATAADILGAERLARKALEIDENNGSAYQVVATIRHFVEWDFVAAEAYYKRAMEVFRNDPNVLAGYSILMSQTDQCDKAEQLLNRTSGLSNFKAWIYVLLGEADRASDKLRTWQISFGDSIFADAGEIYLWTGDFDTARYFLETAVKNNNPLMELPRFRLALAAAYHKTGEPGRAEEIIDQLIKDSYTSTAGSPAFYVASYYGWIGRIDSAFFWLEQAYRNGSMEMPWLRMHPAFKSLKGDPRYWDLYERTGHKAYDDYIASRKE
jgi:TolB-like protein/Tfp pilus assembly protein PilF